MIVKVHEHTIEIEKSPVNELEVNVTKVQFEFDETIPDNYVKKAFFSNDEASIEILLDNNECEIPNEVLTKKGTIRLGVIAYEVQDDELIQRFNPNPAYFYVSEGSMIEADNTEPITPTDKEQIEALVQEVQTQMDNIDIEAEKVEHTTTITITDKDGETNQVQILDGEKGDKGDKGDAGAIKMIIVNELPTTGQDDTIYLVPAEDTETGNNYDEYIYVNNQWEKLGGIQVEVDLTNYVQFNDYAGNNNDKAGTIKVKADACLEITAGGVLYPSVKTYQQYVNSVDDYTFTSKGTLENVITGKGLTTKSYVDGLVGDINSALDLLNGEVI